jgi:hypothetical protein
MKNLHVLPTDKPSRLWTNNLRRRLELDEFPERHPTNIAKHIYITSDEEIKEGDYFWKARFNMIFKAEYTPHKGCEKVILTTDPDLIRDGVQAIHDEFLEWFVKNPSCESVEVSYGLIKPFKSTEKGYMIHLPDTVALEKPKQETLEEVKNGTIIQFLCGSHSYDGIWFGYNHPYREGNFWWRSILQEQDKKMYSKEEVQVKLYECLGHFAQKHNIIINGNEIDEWFNQFKKK